MMPSLRERVHARMVMAAAQETEVHMRGLLRTIVIAGATAAASWIVARWLEARRAATAAIARRPIEQWESEGGALAPQQGRVETSQVPR